MNILKDIFFKLFLTDGIIDLNFNFWLTIVLSIIFGGFCFFSFYLWVRNTLPPSSVIILSIFGLLVSFTFFGLLIGSKFLGDLSKLKIKLWEEKMLNDSQYLEPSFTESYYGVKNLGIEDFTDYPSPENDGNTIPATNDESKILVAQIYYSKAVQHFKEKEWMLDYILNPKSKKTPKNIKVDMDRHFETNSTYPVIFGASIAAKDITDTLINQTPRIVLGFRIILISFFVFIYLLTLILIANIAIKKL